METSTEPSSSVEQKSEPKQCKHCGRAFVPSQGHQQYDSPKCRFDAANRIKAQERRAVTQSRSCAIEGCTWRSRLGRFYEHLIGGVKVVLCGWHHAKRYRRPASGNVGPLIGRYYGGYFHVAYFDVNDQAIADDGGIDQLINHLSGEVDSTGRQVPHPFVCWEFERTVYQRQPGV